MAGRPGLRRDSKHRVLRRGESIRADGKYQFKYHVNGKPHFVYSWRLEPTDKLPVGKSRACHFGNWGMTLIRWQTQLESTLLWKNWWSVI